MKSSSNFAIVTEKTIMLLNSVHDDDVHFIIQFFYLFSYHGLFEMTPRNVTFSLILGGFYLKNYF